MRKNAIKLLSIFGASILLLTSCNNSEDTTTSGHIAESVFDAIANTRDNYQMNIETGLGYVILTKSLLMISIIMLPVLKTIFC